MRYLVFFFTFLMLTSCNSIKKIESAFYSGDYVEAINRSVHQLQKNKSGKKSSEYSRLLKQSFEAYRESTLDKIDFLERETLKDNSKQIYESYVRLQSVQNTVKPLMPLKNSRGEDISFSFYDFSENIIDGKENYANYLYTKASDLLETNDKINSRLAYNSLVELEKLAPNYKDASSLKRDAYIGGVDFILVSLYNDTQQIIPAQVEDRLLNFSTYKLDDLWTEYHVNSREDIDYDFAIEIGFTSIQFSPERLLEREIPLEREVVDGWRYKKDRSGDFVLDERGNKIKVDVLVTARGVLFKTIQSKEVKVSAEVNYFDMKTNQKINTYPLESLFVFENNFASFEGDKRVLNKDEIFLLRRGPVNYPSPEKMLIDASEDIKSKLKHILKQQFVN